MQTIGKHLSTYTFQTRNWRFYNDVEAQLAVGNGIYGKFPVFKNPEDTFVHSSCVERGDLTSKMEGFYVFRYLKDNEEADDQEENIQQVD